jgi:septal ring factor EnvC (AmiA/AmiB activator)
VENKQSINTVFGLLIIIFLTAILLVGNTKGVQKFDDDENRIAVSYLLQRRNDKVKNLSTELSSKQSELATLRQELLSVKTDLDSANQKLTKVMAAVPEVK